MGWCPCGLWRVPRAALPSMRPLGRALEGWLVPTCVGIDEERLAVESRSRLPQGGRGRSPVDGLSESGRLRGQDSPGWSTQEMDRTRSVFVGLPTTPRLLPCHARCRQRGWPRPGALHTLSEALASIFSSIAVCAGAADVAPSPRAAAASPSAPLTPTSLHCRCLQARHRRPLILPPQQLPKQSLHRP